MSNTDLHSKRWVEFIAGRKEFRAGPELLKAFRSSRVFDLCTCGCNSFSAEPLSQVLAPLAKQSENGKIAFLLEIPSSEPTGFVEFMVFSDKQGYFVGMDVHFNGNSEPMPEHLIFDGPPAHLYGELAVL